MIGGQNDKQKATGGKQQLNRLSVTAPQRWWRLVYVDYLLFWLERKKTVWKNINLSFLYFSPIMTALLQEYENLVSQVTIIRLWWKGFKNQEDVNTSSKKAQIAINHSYLDTLINFSL